MAFQEEAGTQQIRAQFFDKMVKGITIKAYKFKQALTLNSTSSWKNFFYREDAGVLAPPTGTNKKGIPRGANFPQASVLFERIQTVITKYGLEETIAWEDIISDDVPIRNRTLIKLAEGVARSVDDAIWTGLQGDSAVGNLPADIQTFDVSVQSGGSGRPWNEASAAIIDDLYKAKELIGLKDYPTNNLMVFISERDHRSYVKYLTDKGSQFPGISEGVLGAKNGVIGTKGPFTYIVSNSVTASNALVVVPKRIATWKSLWPLQTITKEEPLINVVIRTAELGVLQLTDPNAGVLITGTQGPGA